MERRNMLSRVGLQGQQVDNDNTECQASARRRQQIMKLSSSALVLGAILIPLGVLLTALGVLSFSNIFDNVLNCIRSPVPIPCGLDPQTELNLIVYPLLAIGLVLIVIGL